MAVDPNNLQNIIHREVFTDPSPGYFEHRIVRQSSYMSSLSDLSEKQQKEVQQLMLVLGIKFVAMWTHDQRYAHLEKELIDWAKVNPIDRRKLDVPMKIRTAQELYIEFDEFLVQVKSALDHMVKVLSYALGLRFIGLTSFAGNGSDVTKKLAKLRDDVRSAPRGRQVAPILIDHIAVNQGWLKGTFDARNRMNHFSDGGLEPTAFAVELITDIDGNEKLHRPQISNVMNVKELMHIVLHSTLDFVEHFMGHAMSVRMPTVRIEYMEYGDLTKPRWFILPAEPV